MRRFPLLLAVLTLPGAVVAGQFGCPTCQSCGGACVLKAEVVTEDETCYDVECKDVCIPAIRFPWDSCREPKCGRVRRVATLKTDSRETKACKYEWVILCPRCGRAEADGESKPTVPPMPQAPDSQTPVPKSPAASPKAPPMPPAAPPAQARWPGRAVWSLQASRGH